MVAIRKFWSPKNNNNNIIIIIIIIIIITVIARGGHFVYLTWRLLRRATLCKPFLCQIVTFTRLPIKTFYHMANPVLGKSVCSDWFFLGQDFAVRTVSVETVQSVYFCFGAKPANSKFATKTAKKKVWIMSFFTLKLSEENKKIENFPKFQR